MRICILTTVHTPFDTRVFHKEAKSLAKVHEVVLVAPDEERADKEVDGVRVITIKKPESKLLHPVTMWRVFKAGFKQDCDVYHCHEPGSLFVGMILKVLKRRNLVYDAHEHYASLIASNRIFPKIIRGIIGWVSFKSELTLSRFADYIIVVRGDLETIFEKVNENVEIIYVCPDLSFFPLKKVNREDLVIYVGAVDIEKRGLDVFLASLVIVSKKIKHIKYLVVGTIPEDDLSFATEYLNRNNMADRFEYTGWVDYNAVPEYLRRAKIGVILLQPVYYNNIMGIPNKLFDCMAAGIPVIASKFPNISKIVKEADCGILVDPTDAEDVADAVVYLVEHPEEAKRMGENGRRAVEERYNWDKMEEKLLKLYGTMINESDNKSKRN
ncbi:MAG: glycosyltransferase family 4 protein [Methanophagales archaeon]|nr:glycosyltransferase family 4 protein [Methanophagales archaeon]